MTGVMEQSGNMSEGARQSDHSDTQIEGQDSGDDIVINGTGVSGQAGILTRDAVAFLARLHRKYEGRRRELMALRAARQERLDAGEMPDFLTETQHIRNADWQIAPLPHDLHNRKVEITAPTGRKMVINALNSGAACYMADFEDSNAPTWANMIDGQINMRDAVRRRIDFATPDGGKKYTLDGKIATLMIRPRGWHLVENHIRVDGAPVAAGIMDFALYFFHNATACLSNGSGPYFYLPKIESHLEARLWNDIFVDAQDWLGIPQGSIRATVLIETILAAFEMDEILYELRDHSAGLNCGRWDYIFSIIKKFRLQRAFVQPDRADVTMTVPNMRAYTLLAIKTCHRRGAPCIGGMAAQIPVKEDAAANDAAFAKVLADKEREVADGHDGTWVAHPGLVSLAAQAFATLGDKPNQIERLRTDVAVTAADLLSTPPGTITPEGVAMNIRVGIRYLEAWLRGHGCVPLYHLMEDTATAEISRAQLWQWAFHRVAMSDGVTIDRDYVRRAIDSELDAIRDTHDGDLSATGFVEAARLFADMSTTDNFPEFLTLGAYDMLIAGES